MDRLVYKKMASVLLSRAHSLVPSWIPGGKMNGSEYVVKNPLRNDKSAGSFRVNLQTGRWAEFATNDRGNDLISLYAYVNSVKNSEAVRMLSMEL